MDFLGLRNLTTLEAAVRLINERHPDAPIDLDQLPARRPPRPSSCLQRGETKGVFQLEIGGHPRPLDQDEARPLRRHHRHQRPVSPRPAQRRHGRRLRRRQERPQAGDLPAPGAQGSPGRNLRRDGLSRTGDADPQPPGGHRALQGVCHDQGDLEEEGRGHRQEPRPVRRRGPSSAGWSGRRPPRSST